MSTKSHKHVQKMARKRAIKAARKSAYAALAGTSKRKKRQNKGTGPTAQRGNHAMENCGNAGCKRCYPALNRSSLNGKTHQKAAS